MKRLFYVWVLAVLTTVLCSAPISIAQSLTTAGPIQTGFVLVTPVQGDGQGISVSETFGQRVQGTLYQSSVLSSPLVTLTDLFVTVDPNTATDTGIAIVNPNNGAVNVTLSLTNQQGATIAVRNLSLGGLQQTSQFATQLFSGTPELNSTFSGLVFIRSDIPVSVMGLTFIGPSFTSLPVAAQLVPTNTINTAITSTPTTTVTTAITTVPAPVPTTISTIPTTITTVPSTFVGLLPTHPIGIGTTTVTTLSGQTTVVAAGTSISTIATTPTVATTNVNTITGTLTSSGSALLPQFATGGGWASQIVIANTSSAQQVVRVEIFNANGLPLQVPFSSQLSSVLIPPGGVVTFSTAN
jgi:hypothetical protein